MCAYQNCPKKRLFWVLSISVTALSSQMLRADDMPRLVLEGEGELAFETLRQGASGESEVSLSFELEAEFALSDKLVGFLELSQEFTRQTGEPGSEGEFQLDAIGFALDLEQVELSFGKFAPVFAYGKALAPGYFGDGIVSAYDLDSALGIEAAFDLGEMALVASVFEHDGLFEDASGDAQSNIGFAVQSQSDFEGGFWYIGARYLAPDSQTRRDEYGLTVGVLSELNNGLEFFAEGSAFANWQGEAETGYFAVVGSSVTRGAFTYSGAYAYHRLDRGAVSSQFSLGLDWHLGSNTLLEAGVAFGRDDGEDFQAFGIGFTHAFAYQY